MDLMTGFLIMSSVALLTNTSTLIYILRSFDVKLHVFGLLAIDASMSTSFSVLAVVLDLLNLSGLLPTNTAYCFWSFISVYVPSYAGAVLTFLISIVRCILAVKAARNIKPPNNKVLKLSVLTFILAIMAVSCYIGVCQVQDLPYGIIVEACMWQRREPREIPRSRVLVLQSPNYYNISALVTDLLMLRFLQKNIQPTTTVAIRTIHVATARDNEDPEANFRTMVNIPASKCAKEIPIRATIFSGLSVVPYVLVLVAIFNLNMSYYVRGSIVRTLFHLLDIFRCPLTTALIFASNRKTSSGPEDQRSNENVRLETSYSASTN